MKRTRLVKFAKLLSISFFLLAGLSTCKKYPEGGFERRGPKLLTKNRWLLTLYEVNGIDSTLSINYNANDRYKEVHFFKEGKNTNSSYKCESFPGFSYSVEFNSNNTALSFRNVISSLNNLTFFCYGPNDYHTGCYRLYFMPEGRNTTWSIIKLTKKEMILTSEQQNNYKLKFKCD